jgi:uncharacterized protein YdaU (DUF1376 family)
MTSGPLWMPLYPGDYLRDTRHLTTLQHGAYLLLIMEYWVKGRLPSTDSERRRITALSAKQWLSNRSTLAALFGPDWRHERIERELEKAKELRLKRAVYGAKGGRMSRGRNNLERFQLVNTLPRKS